MKKRCSRIRTRVRPRLAATNTPYVAGRARRPSLHRITRLCSLRHQRQSLNIPRNVVDGAVGGEDRRLAGSEGQSNQALAGDLEVGLALRSDFDDAAFSGERGGDIDIALDIKSQTLRASQTAVEHRHSSMWVDFVNAVETGSAGAGDEHISLRTERDVIGGNARLQRGEDKNLPVASDLENGSAAVADVEILRGIEGNAGRDPHAFGLGRYGAVRRDFVHSLVMPRRNVHLAFAVESNRGGVHHFAEKRLDVVVRVDLEDRYRNFLPTGSRESYIEVALAIERGIGDRMKVVGNWDRNLDGMSIAHVPVSTHDHRSRRRSLWDASDHEVVGTD